MRRISARSLALALTLVAFGAWSAKTFARDLDEENPRSATGDETTWSSDLEGSNQAGQNQNQGQNRSGRQNRNEDSDQQHHAALGVSMDDGDGSVRVTAVLQGSPAARAGVKVGDEIRSVDGDRIRNSEALAEEIGEKRPGAKIELGIRRDGERRTLQVRLGTQEELYGRNWRSGNRGNYASNDDANNRNGQNGQSNRNRHRASSYDPDSQNENVQSLNQQVRSLRQQVAQLQRQIDELRNQQNGNTRVSSRNRSDNDRNQDND